ncbi:MAG: class I SAM-dependent methyltransferase [Pseudonocardiales bacterium]|nr:class I SAM-dependent methyltransferase [Pseudonocardiales bacterium]
MSVDAVQDYVEGFLAEDDVLLDARARGAGLGCAPITPGGGAGLRFLAATIGARAVVEIGTGTGVSGLWLLSGMAADGTLTSIDVDPEAQRVARGAFVAAGHAPSRLRLINGMGLEVLPRLTDGAYDLVVVDTARGGGGIGGGADYPRYLDEAVRLLRPGGIVVLAGALAPGVPLGAGGTGGADDAGSVALREVARQVRGDERLVALLLPLGDGLLAAVSVG